jgi:hypothetical protein
VGLTAAAPPLQQTIDACHTVRSRLCLVIHEPSGYHLRNFEADAQSLRLRDGPYEVTRLAVAEARLAWPSWQSVQLQARGLRVELLQRQMPQVRFGSVGTAAVVWSFLPSSDTFVGR